MIPSKILKPVHHQDTKDTKFFLVISERLLITSFPDSCLLLCKKRKSGGKIALPPLFQIDPIAGY